MLNNILELIKGTVGNEVAQSNLIPEEKKEETVKTTAQAIGKGLEEHFTIDKISDLTSLFSKESSETNHPVMSGISNTVISDLVQKVGLSKETASSFTSIVIPAVMKALSGKINDPNEQGFNLKSLISSISGSDSKGGILDSIKKFFS